MIMTTNFYDYYLREKAKIVVEMESHGAILDVADNYTKSEFVDMGTLLSSEYPDYNEKQLARLLAERQTYYLTAKEASVLDNAINNFWNELGIPESERTQYTHYDLVYGTDKGRQLHDKFYSELKKLREKKMKEDGMTSQEASRYISKYIYGSP